MFPSVPARNAGYRSQLKPVDNLHALPDALRISPQNAHDRFEYQKQELVRRTKPLFGVMKLRLAGVPTWITGQYIIGTQVYGRLYLKKGMSFGLHKRAFLKTLDGIR